MSQNPLRVSADEVDVLLRNFASRAVAYAHASSANYDKRHARYREAFDEIKSLLLAAAAAPRVSEEGEAKT